MGDFFDESILETKEVEYPIIKKYKDLRYVLNEFNGIYQINIEIGEERLNTSEIKALIELSETKKFLNQDDVELLNYIVHRLTGTMTIYKIRNDFDVIIKHLSQTQIPVFFGEDKIILSNEDYKLTLDFSFDENSNISMEIQDKGEAIFSFDKAFFLKEKTIYQFSEELPVKFYKEIFSGNNKFSIESFLSFKNSFLKKLKTIHNTNLSKGVLELENMSMEQKIAPATIEIGKTSHFIVLELKYKIGQEYFKIEDYQYCETLGWVDKKIDIKVTREENKLVKYISDTTISELIFPEILQRFRIRYTKNSQTPFLIMIPISNLDYFVNKVIPELEKEFEVEYKNGEKLRVVDGNVRFDIETDLKTALNLFEFKVRFKIEDEYFDLDFLKDLMSKSKKYVQLKDGATVNIENIREINKWIEFLEKFSFKRTDKTFQADSKAALELDEFLKKIQGTQVKSNDEYKNLISELKDKQPVMQIDLPGHIDPTLRDYQKEGVYWINFLQKYGFNGILADEMGLGKTIQTLTALFMNKDGKHIVICPKSLIHNWDNEIKKYFPELKTILIDGTVCKRKEAIANIDDHDVVITSYSMIQKDYKEYLDNNLSFKYQILDEAHYVKNIKTLSAKAVRLIQAEHILLLTGTPLENNLDELYGTFDLIMPNFLGTKLEFAREFAAKIERNNKIALELLQAKIRPFILRRTKKEVLTELPEKQEQVVYNEMTNKQIGVYNEVLNRVKNEVAELVEKQGFEKSRIQVLSALLKLRQVCNHPALIDSSFNNELEISGKYAQFLELLQEVIDSGKKVLVFSQFTSMLDIFEKDLNKNNVKFLRLDGSTKNRQDLVDKFNEKEEIKVFLISLKAGGVGLNLTSASAVFLYDPWWNPMVEKQAMDRAHRIGQKNTVNIYKFITKNSIEEKILKLQERKGNLFENLVTEDKGYMKKLEWEDLMELFD